MTGPGKERWHIVRPCFAYMILERLQPGKVSGEGRGGIVFPIFLTNQLQSAAKIGKESTPQVHLLFVVSGFPGMNSAEEKKRDSSLPEGVF